MTDVGTVYGEALYQAAADAEANEAIFRQLEVLEESFHQEPRFISLLRSHNLTKEGRCEILETSFRGRIHPYLLNFLKILTQKGYMGHFFQCVKAYRGHYYQDRGILPVSAVTAVALTAGQQARLTEKLHQITGKEIALHCRIDPSVLGGIRLDFDGRRLDDTLSHRLDALRELLNKTVL